MLPLIAWDHIFGISFSSRAVCGYIGLLIQVRSHQRNNLNIADIFRQRVVKHPSKVCFIFEDKEWTFAQVRKRYKQN
jgi:hypothetical protein